ncbi:MAG: DUF4837 family protein [Bacteroidales bacterium]|nr:DUF4837 family protein [Bacteroidales bacterium]
MINYRKKYFQALAKLFFITSLLYLLSSCKEETNKNMLLPNSSGASGEILLISDDKNKNSELTKLLTDLFQTEQIGLPQSEPIFDLIVIPPYAFKNVFVKHKSIISYIIDSKYKQADVAIQNNVYAQPQTIIQFTAPNERSLMNYIQQNSDKILGHLYKDEQQLLLKTYTQFPNNEVIEQIKKKYELSLLFPNTFKLAIDKDDFLWLSYERSEMSQGIFLYQYPYTDTMQLSPKALLTVRDSLLKRHVPGPRPLSYMTTEYREQVHERIGTSLNNAYTVELRGLWRVEGDYMGGPFVSFTTVDKKKNRIVTVEGFVYAPKFKKREYLRQVEAIIKTLSFDIEKKEL